MASETRGGLAFCDRLQRQPLSLRIITRDVGRAGPVKGGGVGRTLQLLRKPRQLLPEDLLVHPKLLRQLGVGAFLDGGSVSPRRFLPGLHALKLRHGLSQLGDVAGRALLLPHQPDAQGGD